MEQSEKKEQPADAYEAARRAYAGKLGPIMKAGKVLEQREVELKTALNAATRFEPAGAPPCMKNYVGRPLLAVWSGAIVCLFLYAAGWMLLLAHYEGWSRFGNQVVTSFWWLVGLSVLIGGAGYLMYRSRRKEWESENEVYEASDYKKFSDMLEQCRREYLSNRSTLADLLEERSKELLDFPEEELEARLATGDQLFQSEIDLSVNVSEQAEEKGKELASKAEKIVVGKAEDEPDGEFGANVFIVSLVLAIAVGVMIVFHCLIWVLKLIFDISWDTWSWACAVLTWGTPVAFVAILVYGLLWCKKMAEWQSSENARKADEALKEELTHESEEYDALKVKAWADSGYNLYVRRNELMCKLLNKKLAFPIRNLDDWGFWDAYCTYFSMLDEQKYIQTLQQAERTAAVFDFFDKKLKLFYERSIKSEAGEDESLYEPFEWALSNKPVKELRNNYTPAAASKKHVNRLVDKNDNFIDIDSVCEDFVELVNVDTSGMFLEHDSKKVEKKTKEMQRCYNDFAESVNGFGNLVEQINESLGMARMVAYRNLYLGAELVNIVHETGSGGTLTRTDDVLSGLSANSVQVSGIEAVGFTKTAVDILDSSLGAVAVAVDNVLSNKAATKYYKKNPKEALATAAGVAVVAAVNSAIEAWNERNERIERCLATQKELVDKMDETVEQFLDSQAKAARALELIGALVKVNNGFMAVYEPLREKVFVNHKPSDVTMKELQQLVLAIKDYKSISDAKL